MIQLTVPELGRLQFSINRQLKVPIFTFFFLRLRNDLYCVKWGVKLYSLTHFTFFGDTGGQISNLIFLTP